MLSLLEKMKQDIITILIGIAVILILIGAIVLAAINGGDPEEAECLKWQSEAKHFEGYYLLQWQADQCQAHGIQIDAVVK